MFIVYLHVKAKILCFRDIIRYLDCEERDLGAGFKVFMVRTIIRGKFDLYRVKLEEDQKYVKKRPH